MIKLFTMVKDECDIIREWLLYHGHIFGFENIFIIDNISTDGTFEIIHEFHEKGIHIFREKDYSQKGQFMKKLIDGNCASGDIAFPLDIDEFIVYHERGMKDISCDKDKINEYILNIGNVASIYKANYLCNMITQEGGYQNAARDNNCAVYHDYGDHAKSFFKVGLYHGDIDHGNHIGRGNGYFVTNICLVHFHCRNLEQIKKKIFNNVNGLGYPNNIDELRDLILRQPNCAGTHHVQNQIRILEGTYKIDVWPFEDAFINLYNLNKFIQDNL